jgi:hypothetical protein
VKVVDIAWSTQTTTTRPTYRLGTRRPGNAESINLQRSRSDNPTSTNARSSPSRITPKRNRRPRSENEKGTSRQFEQELLQPLAKALRTKLGEAGQLRVNNQPRLISGERVEYATWLEVVLNDARAEVIFRPLSREDFSAVWQWGKAADSSSRFHKATATPATAPERPLTLSPTASAKPQVCGMRNRPTRLAGQSPERNVAAER